jgi:hypothetical protein
MREKGGTYLGYISYPADSDIVVTTSDGYEIKCD